MKYARLMMVKFLQMTRLNKVAHKLFYAYLHGFNSAHQTILPAVETCLKKAIEFGTTERGDYYEFGIFKGYTFWYTQNVADQLNLKKLRYFGFDSFAGLPEVVGRDVTDHGEFYQGQYSSSKEQVTANLNTKGVDWNRTFLVEGFFKDSLNQAAKKQYEMDKISVALIDCDLYSSTAEVLEFIKDMMIDKTILLFDDWNCFNKNDDKGQRKAFRDFLEENKQFSVEEFISFGYYGQTFIVNKSEN